MDVSSAISPQVGAAGLNYLAVLAYTAPTTTTDHIVGLRFGYQPVPLTTAALADAAVTAAKVAPGTLDESKLAFDPATQSELNGAIAAAGLHSVGGLGGLTCQLNGIDGTTVVATATDGRIAITCHVPPPTLCCTVGPADRLGPQDVLPSTANGHSNSGVLRWQHERFRDRRCVRASSTAVSAWSTPGGISMLVRNELGSQTDYDVVHEFAISNLPPLTVDYNVVGVHGSCQLAVAGNYSQLTDQTSELIAPASGPLHRLRLTTLHAPSTVPAFSGCGLIGGSVDLSPIFQGIQGGISSAVMALIGTQPVCWAEGTTAFGACPLP